jgi:hypothetical protein
MTQLKETVRKDFDVEDVLSQLTLDEKISLISGSDPWHTASIPRLGVPSIRLTDGPNGVRGTKFFNGVPAACFPCGKYSNLIQRSRIINTRQVPDSQQHGTRNWCKGAASSRAKKPSPKAPL